MNASSSSAQLNVKSSQLQELANQLHESAARLQVLNTNLFAARERFTGSIPKTDADQSKATVGGPSILGDYEYLVATFKEQIEQLENNVTFFQNL